MSQIHARTERLIGKEALQALQTARVAVFGLGGVGGAAAWALARCGVGTLRLIDCDEVAESNLNRQMVADLETIGMRKTDAAAKMIRRFNASSSLELCDVRASADNIPSLCRDMDVVIDCIDDVDAKEALAVFCVENGIELLASMGTGNKLDPSRFAIKDLSKTEGDPLARVMRRRLRAHGITHLKVCISDEKPVEVPPDDEGRRTPASIAFVPPSAGLTLAGEAVRVLMERRQ